MNDSQQNPLLLSSAGTSAASATQRKFRQNYIQNMLNRSASGLSGSQKSGTQSISTASRLGKSSPGPGSYNIQTSLIDNRPRYFYGKHIPERFHVPSPTRYQPNSAKSSMKQTPRESLSVTKSFKQDETITPGPGAYNPGQQRPVSVHGSINKAIEFEKKPTPGPADYCHQPNFYQTNPKLYRQERMEGVAQPPNYPGPGSYLGPGNSINSMSAVSIKNKYPMKQEITPSFYELDKSFKAMNSSTARPRIGEKFYNAMNDFDGQQAREARINERLKQIQSKRQKNLESQLDQQLRMGRKMLGIGTEGRWVPKADAWAMAERAGVFRFYPMQNTGSQGGSRVTSKLSTRDLEPQRVSRLSEVRKIENSKPKVQTNNQTHETHFAILAPCKTKYAELVIHGKMTFDNNYPHNNCKITILWPKIVFLTSEIILPKQFVENYTPEFGLHWAMQVLHHQMTDFLRDKPDFDIQTLITESKEYKCQQCGCNNEDFYQQLLDNEARYEYVRDELVEQKLGIQL